MTDKTTLIIKPNEVVRFQFDHSNYADLSIDIEGNLTVHNLCGINPKIIDKTESNKIVQHNLMLEGIINDCIKKEHEIMYNFIKKQVGKDFNVSLHCLGSDSVSYNLENLQTVTVPPIDRPLKVGDVLVCNDISMSGYTLKKEYPIQATINVQWNPICLESDEGDYDWFSLVPSSIDFWQNYFTLKP